MEKQELDVFSSESNAAIVRMAGRKFPGVVVQGDTLGSLATLAHFVAESVSESEDEELAGEAAVLRDQLRGLLTHYTTVLEAHGHPLPFSRAV